MGFNSGFKGLRLSDFKISANEGSKFVSPYVPAAFAPHEIFLLLISVKYLVDPRVIMHNISKKFNNTIGNRTRDLQACNLAPQLTARPRTPKHSYPLLDISMTKYFWSNR